MCAMLFDLFKMKEKEFGGGEVTEEMRVFVELLNENTKTFGLFLLFIFIFGSIILLGSFGGSMCLVLFLFFFFFQRNYFVFHFSFCQTDGTKSVCRLYLLLFLSFLHYPYPCLQEQNIWIFLMLWIILEIQLPPS